MFRRKQELVQKILELVSLGLSRLLANTQPSKVGPQHGLGQCTLLGLESSGLSGLSANAHARTRSSKVGPEPTFHRYTIPD